MQNHNWTMQTGVPQMLYASHLCKKTHVHMWLMFRHTNMLQVTELASIKYPPERIRALQRWGRDGGVMIMGYEMYRNLSLSQKIKDVECKKVLKSILVNPGTVTYVMG